MKNAVLFLTVLKFVSQRKQGVLNILEFNACLG
jgi:hypothetical protein